MALIDYANPTRFLGLVQKLLPWLAALTAVTLAIGFALVFLIAPEDYQQGATVKIMYIHVPSAWLSMFCYSVMAVASLGTLVWRHPLSDVAAKAAVPLGAAFTFVCLVTGSLWGKPMWGTWWVWDARLTSVLVLFIMYLGLMALWSTLEDPIKAGRAAAVLTLVGVVNIPIIKFSVDWWNTLHQPASVFRLDGPTIHASMLWPLLITAIGFTFLFTTLHLMAMRNEILRRRIRTLRMMEAAAVGVTRVMFGLGPHWGFILGSYGLAVAVFIGLLAWILIDLKTQRRMLADLEARGVRRRSAGRPSEETP